jgi:hypothetical protein
MKKLSAIFIATLILFVGCKDSEDPSSSNNNSNTLTEVWVARVIQLLLHRLSINVYCNPD